MGPGAARARTAPSSTWKARAASTTPTSSRSPQAAPPTPNATSMRRWSTSSPAAAPQPFGTTIPTSRLRVGHRRSLRRPHQRVGTAPQRQRRRVPPLHVRNQPPHHDQHLPQRRLHLQQPLRLQRPLHRRRRLLRRIRQDAPEAYLGDQLRPRRPFHPSLLLEGARRRRHQRLLGARPEQHGRPHLPVPGRHLQEGPPPRPGAHVIILGGVGFSLLWQEGDKERVKADWKPGSLVVPPEDWFHEHFNSGAEPARYLALRFTGRKFKQSTPYSGAEGADVSVKEGGWQIEYEDEDHSIHELFESELAEHGAACRMKNMVDWCTGVPGPTVAGAD